MSDEKLLESLNYILSAAAVRERCQKFLGAAENNELLHWHYHADRVAEAATQVWGETLANYPDGDVPYHSRWRHFPANRVAKLNAAVKGMPPDDTLSTMTGLVIISVLLDAGAGMSWRYRDPETGEAVGRSEGLALATCDWYLNGGLATDGVTPRADADRLGDITKEDLEAAFQVSADNPLVGVEGRLQLLHSLGQCIADKPRAFGGTAKLGGFMEYALRHGKDAATILQQVLLVFGDIWPGRHSIDDQNLGDVWEHPLMKGQQECDGLVPFHKLSQWLTYSLVETCERAGETIAGVEKLTGLPEYRNGGMLFDIGVITPKDSAAITKSWHVSDPFIVEWRALTVALLDVIGDTIRQEQGKSASDLPLAKILQGGTWSLGRKLAAKNRSDGGSPITLKSDGTVF